MALTPMRALPHAGVSMLGMLPGTAVYVNAGTQLASISRPADVLSPGLFASFVLLGSSLDRQGGDARHQAAPCTLASRARAL